MLLNQYFPEDSSGVILEIGMIYNGLPRENIISLTGNTTDIIMANTGQHQLEVQEVSEEEYAYLTGNINLTNESEIPAEFRLHYAYPNPFNHLVTLKYDIAHETNVDISIYNVNGEFVNRIIRKSHHPGIYKVNWDASNFSTGMYFLKMSYDDETKMQKITLIK